MSTSRSLRRLLALRVLEHERQEAILLTKRQRRQLCSDAIARLDHEDAAAAQARFDGLAVGDAWQALASEMVLACSSWKGLRLAQEMERHEQDVAAAVQAYQQARNEMRQVETAWHESRRRDAQEAVRREQKLANEWYLAALLRRRPESSDEDQSLPRITAAAAAENGVSNASGHIA